MSGHTEIIDDIELLLAIMPERIRQHLSKADEQRTLVEVVLVAQVHLVQEGVEVLAQAVAEVLVRVVHLAQAEAVLDLINSGSAAAAKGAVRLFRV